MDDDKRHESLQIVDSQLLDIAHFCNFFPNIDLAYDIVDNDDVRDGENVTMEVTLEKRSQRQIGVRSS